MFSTKELAKAAESYTKHRITFAQLVQLRSQLTKLYVDKGYVTSGVIIPPQTIKAGVVVIQVVEGSLEKIHVTGTRHLNPSYVRDRLAIAAGKPFSRDRLLSGLQLLQLDPLIKSITADLQAGIRPGTNILEVKVKEANSLSGQIIADNARSPSVGSFQRRVNLNDANLLGLGDGLNIGYTNTDGSNGFKINYSLPVNPRNGKLTFSYGRTNSHVIEHPFNQDNFFTDNGVQATAEVRLPILRIPQLQGVLQLTPFVDVGTVWNNGGSNPKPSTLSSTGFGLLWHQGNSLTARLDWGIPLTSVNSKGKTWQENGLYFSLIYTPF